MNNGKVTVTKAVADAIESVLRCYSDKGEVISLHANTTLPWALKVKIEGVNA